MKTKVNIKKLNKAKAIKEKIVEGNKTVKK